MKKHFILFSCLLISLLSFGQLSVPKFENNILDTSYLNEPLMSEVIKKSVVVIMFRTYSAWGKGSYKILSFERDSLFHGYILKDSTSNKRVLFYSKLEAISTSQDSLRIIWDGLIENKVFSLPLQSISDKECDYIIFDAIHYDLRIIQGNQYKKLDYYAPKEFEENCKSSPSRQTIIRVHDLFTKQTFLH